MFSLIGKHFPSATPLGAVALTMGMMTLSAAVPTVAHAAIVTLTTSDTGGTSTSFNSAGHWSDAQAPTATNDYQVNGGYTIRTSTNSGSYTWNGGKLTIGNGTTANNTFFIKAGGTASYNIADFHLNRGSISAGSNTPSLISSTLTGNLVLDAGGGTIYTNNGSVQSGYNETLNINSNISGSGALNITNAQSTSVAGYTFNVNLNGTNNFSGPTTLTGNTNGNYKLNLIVGAASTLGSSDLTLLPNGNGGLFVKFNNLNTLADDSILTIGGSTSATATNLNFNLNFTGGDIISSLIYNGVTYGPGTYGSAASGAATILPGFVGTGYLSVIPEPATFSLLALGGFMLSPLRRRRSR